MIKLVNMEIPKSDSEPTALVAEKSSEDKGPSYPYGLRLDFSTEIIKKLNIDISQLRVGDKVHIEAEGEVVRVSVSEDQYDKQIRQNLDIQITDLGVDIGGDEGIFNRVFSEIEAEKDKALFGAEAPTAGGFRKGLWEATR
jgi:hypothetical protein